MSNNNANTQAMSEAEWHRQNDYASTRVPEEGKQKSRSIASVFVGISTALFWPLVGGIYVLQYGAPNTWIALAISFAFMIPLVLLTASVASREGLTSALITRGCGFGTAGATIVGVIYVFNFLILAGAEAQIMAQQIAAITPIDYVVWSIIVGLIFIPLIWGGINAIIKVTAWTVFVYPIVIGVAVWLALQYASSDFEWTHVFAQPAPAGVGAAVGITTVLGAFASITGLNPLEVPDYARFMRHRTFRRDSFMAIVMPFIIIFFIATPLGIYFTLVMGEINPGVYFLTILGTGVGVALVWLSQIRVNVTSLHLGSLALRGISGLFNGGERLGRRFWLVIMVGLMILLVVFNIIGNLTAFLQWDGILLLSWTGCLVADLVIVRKLLKIVTGPIEYRDEKLYRYNPVGLTAVIVATIAGSLLWVFSPTPVVHGLAGYIAFVIAIVVHTLMAVATRGRYYFRDASDARLTSGQSSSAQSG